MTAPMIPDTFAVDQWTCPCRCMTIRAAAGSTFGLEARCPSCGHTAEVFAAPARPPHVPRPTAPYDWRVDDERWRARRRGVVLCAMSTAFVIGAVFAAVVLW